MRSTLSALNHRLLTLGPEVRVFIALYMLGQGTARLLTGHSAASINIFTAQTFGLLMLLSGVHLIWSARAQRRCFWPGRIAAILAVSIWIFSITAAWSASAWVSITGACLYLAALVNEVRIHAC
jgi:hypothetical protein